MDASLIKLRVPCPIYKMRCFETQEGLYDCAWNEMNENQVRMCTTSRLYMVWYGRDE